MSQHDVHTHDTKAAHTREIKKNRECNSFIFIFTFLDIKGGEKNSCVWFILELQFLCNESAEINFSPGNPPLSLSLSLSLSYSLDSSRTLSVHILREL